MDIIVSSFGGVGTSPFLSWLSSKSDVNCPRDSDGLKHTVDPMFINDKADKFIFIYGDPVDAILSLYSRKYIRPQFKKLTGKDNLSTLKEYAESGQDLLSYEKQLNNWLKYNQKPVLFLKYPDFWNHESEIINFLGLKSNTKLFNKKERNSKKEDYDIDIINSLEAIYAPLNKKMNELGSFYLNNQS